MISGQGKFFWKLFGGNVLLLILVVGACVGLILQSFDGFYTRELSRHLRTHAQILRELFDSRFGPEHGADLDRVVKSLLNREREALRVTLVTAGGDVLADSEAQPGRMDSHADRLEIRAALAEGVGESKRFSSTVGMDMQYLALRVGPAAEPLGVVRVAMPVGSIVARTQVARDLFLRVAWVVLGAAVVLALGLAKLWSGRIARVTATARSLSRGDLSARAQISGSDEVGLLARSLNQMRDHLATHLATIDRQRRTLEYLLAQLQEGVVVADPNGDILIANPSAARLLDRPIPLTGPSSDGSPDALTVKAFPMELEHMLIIDRRREVSFSERRITVANDDGERTLLARAADISLPQFEEHSGLASANRGRLLVLTDITELTRAIQVKSDFVANASHELRTPLSAIRAAVETLMSIDLDAEPSSARPLLSVIDRHSERLSLLVSDLLDLSRLESGLRRFEPSTLQLPAVIEETRARFADRIRVKNIDWQVQLDGDLPLLWVSRELLTLVLDNLVDNALKFTEEGGRVQISCRRQDDHMLISVQDTGCGIAPSEQGRVFERFYQVERSRSGGRPGTGLGLAIVRHAVGVMNGRIDLQSAVERGTTLQVHLPMAAAPREHAAFVPFPAAQTAATPNQAR